jgi:hypothetical protein
MGLNDMNLQPFLLQELYGNHLLDNALQANATATANTAKDEKNDVKTAENSNIKFLGKNEKNILLLVNDAAHSFLGDDELALLLKILSACNIAMQHVALVNLHKQDAEINAALQQQFTPRQILFFGTTPEAVGFPFQIPHYKLQQYNQQQFLVAPPLQLLHDDKEAKKSLWTALKNMFSN